MEAESKDVSSIQDEDVLRRMWQQTEDFGRKKEIRAHMYKLRETRLKEFYTSGEVLKDVQRSNSSPGLRDQHSKNPQWQEGPTHADSLADHSFLSLKSKEIRDSESPTRDVQYRNSRNRAAGGDNGVWTISANTEKSDDGKRVTSSRVATTQGSRPLDGGELSYAATNEQLSSVYADGDANNFTKCVGESSKSFAQQNVTVGDDKNYHSSKSTTSSSSSKVVSHHSSTTGNVEFDDFNNAIQDGGSTTTVSRKIYSSEVPSSNVVQDGRTTTTVTRKVYTSDAPDGVSTSTTVTKQMKPDIPDDLKKSIADGNTKVITETKTLPDGSTVTTTRYETKGSKKWSSTTGSSQVITNRQVMEQKNSSSTIDNKHIDYVGGDDRDNVKRTVVVTKTIRDSTNDNPGRQSYPEDYPDNINKTETIRIINSERNVYEDDVNRSNTVHVKRTQDVHDQRKVIRRTEDVTEQDRKVTHKPDTHDDQPRTNEIVKVTKIITRNDEDQFHPSQRKPVPGSEETYTTVTTTKTTVTSGVSEKVDDKQVHHHTDVRKDEYIEIPDKTRPVTYQPQGKEPLSSRLDNRQPTSSNPRDQVPVGSRPDTKEPVESRPYDRQPMPTHPQEPMGSRPQEREPAGKRSEEPMTSRPQDRQPIGSRPEDREPAGKRSEEPMTSRPQDRQPMGSRPEDREPAGSRPDNREPAGLRPQNREPIEKYLEEPSSCRPQGKQPSRPQDIEFSKPKPKDDAPYKPSTPTDDQYTTTYRQEYVNKRISVDVSPTHDAFARSLRAISPDRMSDRPKSRGSLRTSTSSLRSSISPEKTPRYQPDDRKQPSRMSPERKPTSDSPRKRTESPRKHSPERATSPKKVTSPDRPRVSQSPDKKSLRTTGSPDRKPCIETVIRTTVTKTTTTGQPDKPYSTDTITKRKPDDRKSPEKQINSDTLQRKKTTPTQDYSPVRTPSPTKPSDRSSPSKTIPINQASPERPIPVRGTSPTKPADRSSPVRSPTKPSNKSSPPGSPTKPTSTTEIITINTDTLTRKKKIPTSEEPEDKIPSKPVDQSSPVRSPTKTTETLIMTKTGTVTKKTDSPTDDSPRDKTKPDRDSPTKPTDKNERIITETTTVTTKRYPDSPSDTKVPKPKKPSSRDSSPTCSASDIEFINHNSHIVTDLDEPCDDLVPEKRPTSLDIDVTTTTTTTRKVKQVTDRSPSAPIDSPRQKSPVKDSPRQKSPTKSTPTSRSPVKESPTKEKTSPVKEVPKKNSIKMPTPEKDSLSERPPTHFLVSPDDDTPVDVCERPKSKEPKDRPPLIRSETYEKRCRTILGLPDNSSPHKPNTGREPIEEPEFIKQQKQPDDEYAGREPVDEPLFVKKHFDMHCREDELIKENVERITKHRPRNDDQPDDEDYPVNREPRINKETTEFITSERTDVKKYRQPTETEPEPVDKSNKDKPADKIKRPSERKPEQDTTEKKPVQKIPTLERKSPEKQKYPDTKQPQQKKPKDGQPDDGEYVTEYTDEYCERPVSKKPEQKIPKDNLTKTTVTETTTITDRKIGSPTGKKPVRDNSSPDRKYPDSKLRQPSKKQPKEGEPDDRDFTTEYIDEYCEVPTDRDGDIPRKPDQKITKENVITTAKVNVTKVTEVTDKKLTRQIPSPIRKQPSKKIPDDKQKRPKKQKPEGETDEETDEEFYTDEYNRTTQVITTDVTEFEKPSDRKPIEDVRNKKPQDIASDKKPLRESPDRKSPKDTKPTETKQKRPDEKEEYVDEYHRTTKVTNIVNGRKPVDERPGRKLPEDSDTEMEPEDRYIPREPKDQKTPSSRVTSTTTKTVKTITTTGDKKPVRESPSPDRKKPTQDKPRPNRDQPDDIEEYNRITKVVTSVDRKIPVRQSPSPDRKKPTQDKPRPNRDQPDDVVEYNRITKVVTSVDRKIPVRQSPSPDRKQPKKLRPDDTEPVTEYTDEYCNKPTPKKTDKITSKTTVETTKVVTSTDQTTKSVTKKPGSDRPVLDKKHPVQDKKKPKEKPDDDDSDDREFTSEYIDEYSEVTTKETKTQKKPSTVEKYSDAKPKTSSPDHKSPVEVTRQSPSRDLPHKTTIITDLTDEYHITNRGVPESDKPYGRKPQTADFINSEKYDTDITLEIVEHTKDRPGREPKPVRQIPDVHYDIENEDRQEEHIRTHRIDTTVTTDEVTRETSPRRYPQKAVPTDTMECTFRKPEDISDDENVAPSRKPSKPDSRKPSPDDEKVSRKTKKPDSPEDRKTPVKQLKDTRKESLPKTVTQTRTTKVITKKTSTPDVDTKRRVTDDSPKRKTPIDDIPKRKSPNDEKIPKEKSPIRQERPKQRSPSPVYRTKKVVETERVITTQMTRKPSNKDLPTRKTPDMRGKITDHPTKPTTSRTPSESPIRKPLYTSPAASPERKPTTAKPSPKVPHKESTQSKPTEPSKKHVVTKTISLNRKPDTKPQVSSGKSVPKTITTVKTTRITQPSSVTVTTVKTTKTSKKTTKPKKVDTYSSDTESEPEIVDEIYDVDVITNKSKTTSVDKKKVITTAKINITSPNNVPKYQSPLRGKEPEITTPSYKVNASETITITTNKSTSEPVTITTEQVTIMSQNKPLTKCITTKSIVLNKDEPIDQEIVIDLQRSTSSREPSPDKICPIPVSSEDETGYPRYPDEVSEPDDTPYRRKPQKVSDIPLTEGKDVRDFNRITEVSERITRKPVTRISEIDKVTDTDESLLSVTEKVSRFITTAEKLTTDDQPKSKKPAPKVPRPELVVTDDLEDDECLLSVSDKVSKFITTAEHVSTRKHDRPQSPAYKPEPVHDVQVEEDDECLLSVNEKVTHFIEAAKTNKQKPTPKEPASKVLRPEFTDIDETLKTDECLLSVSDKVSKFLTTAEKLTTTEVQMTKMEPREKVPSRHPSPEKVSPDTSKLRQSPARKTPERTVKKSPNSELEPIYQEPTGKSPEITSKKTPKPVTGVKQSTRPVSEPTKITPSEPKPVNLKSSEAVRKAKAMFENINKSQEVPKQRDILSRPSVWEGRKKPDTKPTDQQPVDKSDIKLIDIGVYKKKEPITDVRKQLIYTSDEEEETCKRITTNLKDVTLKSTKLILNEKKSSTSEQVTTIPKYGSPDRETPGYMKPIGKHEHGSHEDIPSKFAQKPRYGSPEREMPSKLTQKPRHDSPDRDTPGYMRPIGTHRHPSHEDIPSKFSHKPRHGSPDRDMPSKLTQRPRHGSPDRDTPGYMRPLGKHEHPSHEDIPSKVAHKPRSSSPERDSPTKSTYRPRHSSPEGDMPGYMRPIGRHDSPHEDMPSKYTHKPRHSSPERDSYTRPGTKVGTITHEEVTIDKKTVLRSKQTPDRDVPGYMRPISKVSPEDRNKYIIETRSHHTLSPERDSPNYKKSVVEHEEYETETRTVHRHRYPDDDDMPGYMRPLNRCLTPDRDVHSHKKTVVKEEEIIVDQRHRHSTPDRDVPGYMKPLQRHAHSPDHDSERLRDVPDSKRVPYRDDVTSPTNDDGPRAGKKFGVTLRRTDSGRMVTTTTSTVTERRRSSTPGQPVIEDIQDLDLLERMMDKVVGYEQRRRIRSQIRVVRRLISENKIQYTTQSLDRKKPTKQSSPVREPLDKERRSPSKDVKKITSQPSVKKPGSNHNNLPEDKVRYQRVQEKEERKTEYKSSYTRDEQTSERVTSKDRSMSPEPKKKPQTTPGVYKTDLKPVQPVSKVVSDDKPSWVTNRNLKKTVTETTTEERRNNVPLKKKETPRRSPSPQKEVKPIDCITSSYGIGPTDENGQPLFGIRALRKAAATDKVQVRGTVVTSQFYSENGKEPVGEVTVTKYSNNPKELEIDDEQISKAKGFASVTTTQKFGTRGAPTLKSVIDNKKAITDKQSEEDEIFKTTTTKVTRRGSVKALSQKFIENAVEISRNERQTYPKAGLILRTSSFKETAPSDRSSSRESSPGYQGRPGSGKISLESITSDSRNNSNSSATTRHTDETKTFLNSHTRVANAQEVITRMKNAEREERDDDSPEDKEARMLLNKFLGAQVLMSGMEPLLANKTASTTTASAQLVRKVQKTKTITSSTKDSGNTKPSISLTKRFQCPITPEVLEDIWDEQTLRLLLEQCTDYEERRHIRARLRQVMAEQEAVANVVASAVAERDGDADRTAGSLQERIETTKKTFSEGPVTTTQVSSTRVISSNRQVNKPISPFAKFRQLDKQNSLNSPPSSPRTPGGGSGAPLFKFTDPALSHSASTVKDRLLHWCQMKTKEYQNIKLENFSTCWADGLAFCALIHHFLPDAFDYHALTPQQRRHNFTLAFKVADEQAGIAPLLDVDDMVAMRRPDWKCVFTYVQSIYRRFKDED